MFHCCQRVGLITQQGSSDVILTSNGRLLFWDAWWAHQVTSTGPSASPLLLPLILKCKVWPQQSGFWVCHSTTCRKGFSCAGWILVKESGSFGIVFPFFSSNFSCPLCLPVTSSIGWWKVDMLVPWLRGGCCCCSGSIWSILSIAAVVNNPFRRSDGHTAPSTMYLLTVACPNCGDISNTLFYAILRPWSWRITMEHFYMCLQHQVFGHNFLDRGPIQLKLVALCFVYIGLQQSKGTK